MQDKSVLYQSEFEMSVQEIEHERKVYGILDLFGDVGGILDIFILLFGIFIFPYSEHSFKLSSAREFFMAKTRDNALFKGGNPNFEKFPNYKSVKINVLQSIKVFFGLKFGLSCSSRQRKLVNFFEESAERFDKNLDLVNLIKLINGLKFLLKT